MVTGKNIYIELDSIVDVRLAIICALHPKGVTEVYKKYENRLTDNFGNIPINLFRAYYEKRSKKILEYGIPTGILKVLGEVILDTRSHITRATDKATVYVNTYPYVLTEDERKLWLDRLTSYFPIVEFEFIRLKPIDVTPKFIIDNEIFTIIMYYGLEWMDKQVGMLNMLIDPLANRSLVVPAIVASNPKGSKIDKEVFETVSKHYEVFMEVAFVDVKHFSGKVKDLKIK